MNVGDLVVFKKNSRALYSSSDRWLGIVLEVSNHSAYIYFPTVDLKSWYINSLELFEVINGSG